MSRRAQAARLRAARRRAYVPAPGPEHPRCAVCNSADTCEIATHAATGVTAPGGGNEYRWSRAIHCRACGSEEEI